MFPGIVHIGVGGFNRSHLAAYLDDLLNRGTAECWGEFGVGLLPGDASLHAALEQQDYLYGLMLVDSDHREYRVIGSLTGHLYAPESSEAVIEKLSAAECAIVSLTVTESGYFIEDATGRFVNEHIDVRHDLEHPGSPRTWLGYVSAACERRMRLGGPSFTLLSCDNLHGNGATARKALLAFAEAQNSALRRWMEAHIAFPNSMVDRITPRTTEREREVIAENFGVIDRAPVVSEPFRQWVLEDTFANGRPEWELVGAQITSDVVPYEKTKMRLLNGGHSSIGYAADLLGYGYIADAARDPLLRKLLTAFMQEVRQTVGVVAGINLDEYCDLIVSRFSNTAIADQVSRICSDGSAKMVKFIVPSLRDLLEEQGDPRVLPFVLASWLHYLRGRDENGRAMTISDPSVALMKPFLDMGGSDAGFALSVRPLFGDLATTHPEVVNRVQRCLDDLRKRGVCAAVSRILELVHAL
jgi:mannitol 2-dehydrogenase